MPPRKIWNRRETIQEEFRYARVLGHHLASLRKRYSCSRVSPPAAYNRELAELAEKEAGQLRKLLPRLRMNSSHNEEWG